MEVWSVLQRLARLVTFSPCKFRVSDHLHSSFSVAMEDWKSHDWYLTTYATLLSVYWSGMLTLTCAYMQCSLFNSCFQDITNSYLLDCCVALLRVYLLGHHVVPILIFRLGSCPRPHFDRGCGGSRTVHKYRFVVRNATFIERPISLINTKGSFAFVIPVRFLKFILGSGSVFSRLCRLLP